MKLSEKQKGIIELMRQGYELFTWTDEHFGKKGQTVYKARIYQLSKGFGEKERTKMIHHSTFISLRRLNLIDKKPYYLTELGKTIQL